MNKTVVAFTLLLLLAATSRGQNQIYVNQITTGGTTTLVQVGSLNKIGSSGTPSDITGDNIVFEMRQIGSSNTTDFSIANANNLKFISAYTGDSNKQLYYFNGAGNNMNFSVAGNSNAFLLNKDTSVDHTSNTDDSKATLTNTDMKFTVAGNSNTFKFGISSGNYNYLDYNVTGSSNTIKSTQIGNTGGSSAKDGHEQTVAITGSSNDLTIYQAGLEKQLFNYTLTGSSNTVKIVQTQTGYAPAMTTSGTNGPSGTAQTTNSITPPGP
mgnify:CR=1 FL=1